MWAVAQPTWSMNLDEEKDDTVMLEAPPLLQATKPMPKLFANRDGALDYHNQPPPLLGGRSRSEPAPPVRDSKSRPCFAFESTGSCRFGRRCIYSHEDRHS